MKTLHAANDRTRCHKWQHHMPSLNDASPVRHTFFMDR